MPPRDESPPLPGRHVYAARVRGEQVARREGRCEPRLDTCLGLGLWSGLGSGKGLGLGLARDAWGANGRHVKEGR